MSEGQRDGGMGRGSSSSHPTSPTPPAVQVDDVVKRYGDVVAVGGVSLDVAPGSFVSLLGPSGCGKTTLLRLVGGFETPDAGAVRMSGADVTRRPPQARPTAMVFQSYALFPTMTVGENVAYGLRVTGTKKAEARERAGRALRRVDLGGLDDRPVAALSGGQQQRVALARAIAVEPEVLLFDEPLSNLDAALREATRAEVKALQSDLGTTSLWVTHDQAEALALSDRVALMRAGRVVGEGAPEDLYAAPPTAYAARFLGRANVVRGALAERLAGQPAPPGHALAVRPEGLAVAAGGAEGAVPARLVARQFLGHASEWEVEVDAGDAPVRLRLWTDPGRAVPADLAVRAASPRWVPDDEGR
ncbi:ABC transporter ATP-binding protein [Rubrivirga sp. S365]|nr:ABC transporter ATP-binding protein [Rubrivirga sp. S365]MDT7856784.1 ABC transporter ATP-binding protein [Rubrivirga sp. S365]